MVILLPSIDLLGVSGVSMVKCIDYPFQRLHGDQKKHLNLSMLIFVCPTTALKIGDRFFSLLTFIPV